MIPVIDLFAGPGGLCEGFSHDIDGEYPFKTVLSIEKDSIAHRTLELRAFVHYFMRNKKQLPDEYYSYVYGKIERCELFNKHAEAAAEAREVAWCAELGGTKVSKKKFDAKIKAALGDKKDWLLIGGPPCQAYSLVGRSRSVGGIKNREIITREEAEAEFNKDRRQRLYRQYLRVIAVHAPAIFVMENVAGMLSAKVDKEPIFPKILSDLKSPCDVAKRYFPELRKGDGCKHTYRIFSFVTGKEETSDNGERFLIRAENFGIPQCRHRVILLGIRDDLFTDGLAVDQLVPVKQKLNVRNALCDLPKIRSEISRKTINKNFEWLKFISGIKNSSAFQQIEDKIRKVIAESEQERNIAFPKKANAVRWAHNKEALNGWYEDKKLLAPLNHEPRSHMPSDLWRYLFVASFGHIHGRSPVIADFPKDLLPNHRNVKKQGDKGAQDFADRFKVQIWGKPASTVTSHISKDGHYFIHPDPVQCRSLSVREAARLQTFPDNYFFEGNRTQQYHQVGNAVPPYLAHQIAKIVYAIFKQKK